VDPITLAILTGAAGNLLSGAGAILPSKLERENKKRMDDLQRQQELGALGLNEKEQASFYNKFSAGAQQVQDQAEQERARYLAGSGGATGGGAMEQLLAGEQAQQALQTDIAGKVLEADLAKEQAQKDELAALQAADAEKKQARLGAFMNVGTGVIESGLGAAAQQAVIQGPKDVSPETLNALAKQLDVTPEAARGLMELAVTNPSMMKYLTALQGK